MLCDDRVLKDENNVVVTYHNPLVRTIDILTLLFVTGRLKAKQRFTRASWWNSLTLFFCSFDCAGQCDWFGSPLLRSMPRRQCSAVCCDEENRVQVARRILDDYEIRVRWALQVRTTYLSLSLSFVFLPSFLVWFFLILTLVLSSSYSCHYYLVECVVFLRITLSIQVLKSIYLSIINLTISIFGLLTSLSFISISSLYLFSLPLHTTSSLFFCL